MAENRAEATAEEDSTGDVAGGSGDDPAQFYTGLVAELYALLRGSPPDVDVCERVLRDLGEPALELGCGDGDPLIELRHRGLEVEGLDSSLDMVERARRRAEVEGVAVKVHHADMTSMSLDRRFRTIFLAGPTFNLLPDDDTTTAALVAIRQHLDDGGRAFIPLFVPGLVESVEEIAPHVHVEADGTELRCTVTSVERDEVARLQTMILRYERRAAARRAADARPDGRDVAGAPEVEVLERPWLLHWHTQSGFRQLAEAAGLVVESITDYHGEPTTEDATYIHVTCRQSALK